MIQVDQIFMTSDSAESEGELSRELTFDEIQKYGESLFPVGSKVTVYFTDGTQWLFERDSDYWDVACITDKELVGYSTEDCIWHIRYGSLTLEESINAIIEASGP